MTARAVTISKAVPLIRLGRLTPLAQCGVLTAVLGLMFCIAAPIGFLSHGWPGVVSIATAFAVCWIAGVAGSSVSEFLTGSMVLFAFLLAMAIRMAFPLGVLLFVWVRNLSMLRTGFVPALLCCYLVVLAMETLFACSRLAVPDHSKGNHCDG